MVQVICWNCIDSWEKKTVGGEALELDFCSLPWPPGPTWYDDEPKINLSMRGQ
jgi:hypothetical protein